MGKINKEKEKELKGISLKKKEGKKLWDTFRPMSSCFGSRKDPTKFVYLAVNF